MAVSGQSKVWFKGGPMDGFAVNATDIPFYNGRKVIMVLTRWLLHAYLRYDDNQYGHVKVAECFSSQRLGRREIEAEVEAMEKRGKLDIYLADMFEEDIEVGDPEYFEVLDKDVKYNEEETCRDLGPSEFSKRKRGRQRPYDDLWGFLDENGGKFQ